MSARTLAQASLILLASLAPLGAFATNTALTTFVIYPYYESGNNSLPPSTLKGALKVGDQFQLIAVSTSGDSMMSVDLSSLGLPATTTNTLTGFGFFNFGSFETNSATAYNLGVYTVPSSTPDGTREIQVNETNPWGGNTATTTITVDNVPPTVSITNIKFSNPSPKEGDYMYISGRVDGTGSIVHIASIVETASLSNPAINWNTGCRDGISYGTGPIEAALATSTDDTFTDVPIQIYECGNIGWLSTRSDHLTMTLTAYDSAGNVGSGALTVPTPKTPTGGFCTSTNPGYCDFHILSQSLINEPSIPIIRGYSVYRTAVRSGDTPSLRVELHSGGCGTPQVTADLSSLGLGASTTVGQYFTTGPNDHFPQYYYDFGPLPVTSTWPGHDGTYPISFTATCDQSNFSTTTSTSMNFVVDNVSPTLSLTKVELDPAMTDGIETVYLSGTVSGTGSAVRVATLDADLIGANGDSRVYSGGGNIKDEEDRQALDDAFAASTDGTFTRVPIHLWWSTTTAPTNIPLVVRVTMDAYDEAGFITPKQVISTPFKLPDPCVATNTCVSNVLFLPGIEASRLYRPDYNGGTDRLWEPTSDADIADLDLDGDGKSVRFDVYTRDIIDEAYGSDISIVAPNIYKSFEAKLDQLKQDKIIKDWEAIPYDWRLSLDDILNSGNRFSDGRLYYSGTHEATTSPYIIQELNRLAATSPTHKVTIVAHSNGGLVAKALMQKLGDTEAAKLIDKVILVASPQIGTPEAIGALMHGEDQAIPSDNVPALVSKHAARTFAQNSPMVYNLLPSANYFTQIDDPVVSFDSKTLADWAQQYGNVVHSQSHLNNFLEGALGKVYFDSANTTSPTDVNTTLLTKAETLHASLDAWVPPQGIKVIQIAGWGIPTTVKGLEYSRSSSGELSLTASTTIDGDGTVVVPSALWMSTTTGNVEDYWVNLKTYNKLLNRLIVGNLLGFDHKNIFEVNPVLAFVSDQIIGAQKKLDDYGYFSTSTPISNPTDVRLRYALHSPLTLDLYDDQGRHTGISTTTGTLEEQIPGTYYMEYGEVKYLFTDTDAPTHVVMNGYATSTFTFNVQQYQGDTVVASTTFQDIPTTPQTKVTLDAQSDLATLSSLHVDEIGNGHVLNVVPSINGTAFFDAVPPEAIIGFATTTQKILVTGVDETSTTTIRTTATSTIIIDLAGNTLTLATNSITKPNYAALVIPSLKYSTGTTTLATTTLRYFWATDKAGKYTLLISAVKTPTDRQVAIYTSLTNKTYVIAATPNDDTADLSLQSALLLLRKQLKVFTGVKTPLISTRQGVVGISYQ